MLAVTKSTYHQSTAQLDAEAAQVRAAVRDRRQFAPLYDKYYEPIYHYVFARVSQEEIADEVVSQTFLKAMQQLPRYQFRGVPFGAWLYRIAQNELNQVFRQRKAQRVVSVESERLPQLMVAMWEEEGGEPDRALAVEALIEALRELKPAEVELIELRFFEGRPFKEVAHLLGITETNAKVRVYRTLEKLKKRLIVTSPRA